MQVSIVRYPYDLDNPVLNRYLDLFNRLAGAADEMGSFVNFLKWNMEGTAQKAAEALKEKDKAIAELKEEINRLEIEKSEKTRLDKQIESISDIFTQNPWSKALDSFRSNSLSASLSLLTDKISLTESLSDGIKLARSLTEGMNFNKMYICAKCGSAFSPGIRATSEPAICEQCLKKDDPSKDRK